MKNALNTLTPEPTTRALVLAMTANIPVVLWGKPGIGKSQIIAQVAARLGLTVFDVRLSNITASDLAIPAPHTTKPGLLNYYVAGHVPFEVVLKDRFPDGDKHPCLLLLDELDRPSGPDVQNMSLQLLLDRTLAGHRLGENVVVAAAGNGSTDVLTYELSAAQKTRLCHINVVPDMKDWLAWANANGVDARVIALAMERPDVFRGSNARTAGIADREPEEQAIPTPRTWEFVSRILTVADRASASMKVDDIKAALIAGLVGNKQAADFIGHMQTQKATITVAMVVAKGKAAGFPTEQNLLMGSVMGVVATYDPAKFRKTNPKATENVAEWLASLPREVGMFGFTQLGRKHGELLTTKNYLDWQQSQQ
jgi:MoxR-like ATPase